VPLKLNPRLEASGRSIQNNLVETTSFYNVYVHGMGWLIEPRLKEQTLKHKLPTLVANLY
jgi:hypothetical protein